MYMNCQLLSKAMYGFLYNYFYNDIIIGVAVVLSTNEINNNIFNSEKSNLGR